MGGGRVFGIFEGGGLTRDANDGLSMRELHVERIDLRQGNITMVYSTMSLFVLGKRGVLFAVLAAASWWMVF